MKNSKADNFERQIERIHSLLEKEGSIVTWDDKIPDPDNPEQPRQIDVTIRRDDKLTIVECRIHKAVQDVKWIEELIGRKQSLQASAVIAVSASGFTKGAIKKAEKYGIILRSLQTLTADEIQNWGKSTKVSITYYEFTGTLFTFKLPTTELPMPLKFSSENGKPVPFRKIFELLMQELDDKGKIGNRSATMEAQLSTDILVSGIKPVSCRIRTNVRKVVQERSLASVIAYKAPDSQNSDIEARVEKLDLGGFEIIQSADTFSTVVDLSEIDHPPNCVFYTVNFDFGRVVTSKWVQFIGVMEAMKLNTSVQFRFEFA